MEKSMSTLKRLQAKIESWKIEHEALKSENAELKIALSKNISSEEEILILKKELADKDQEIEKIIAQVETLLS